MMKFKVKRPLVIGKGVLDINKTYDSKDIKVADKHVKSWIKSGIAEEVKSSGSKNKPKSGGNKDVSKSGERSGGRSDSKSAKSSEE